MLAQSAFGIKPPEGSEALKFDSNISVVLAHRLLANSMGGDFRISHGGACLGASLLATSHATRLFLFILFQNQSFIISTENKKVTARGLSLEI